IRDFHVTGVQTCALPISATPFGKCSRNIGYRQGCQADTCFFYESSPVFNFHNYSWVWLSAKVCRSKLTSFELSLIKDGPVFLYKIGRASCRERGLVSLV